MKRKGKELFVKLERKEQRKKGTKKRSKEIRLEGRKDCLKVVELKEF